MNSISRRRFLGFGLNAAILVTVPQILTACSSNARKPYEREDVLTEAILSENLPPILKAIRIGISAPNPHNVQPWKFRILSEDSALLYVDEKRLLKETDPPSRQIHIGQGTFLETLFLAAPLFGHVAEISLFPEGKYTDQDFGKKPVAKIILKKQNSPIVEDLAHSISERRTIRSVYEGPDLGPGDAEAISKDANIRYSVLNFIPAKSSERLREKLFSAMEMETYSFSKYEETRVWFRYDDEEIGKFRDGISMRGFGVSGIRNFVARNLFLTPGKDIWHSQENQKAGLEMFLAQVNSSKGFIYLKTKRNEIMDWVQVGRDYARLHLAAVKNGFAMHPMSQILQEFQEMNMLRTEFEKDFGVAGGEKIQMLVRLGRSDYRYFSPRRKYQDFLGTEKA